ncbi:hypothetical protein [Pelagibacterium montanilacus]|uniref:hypothetical protein n=1 Tax=Pelagibacterium montanilacus TaxID=2185280 RepID=UPI000F8CF310|nr:hypothetical protein [Pelagibacterium montanilacus]
MEWVSYSEAMGETDSYLTVTLDLDDPVEISDFAAFFAGLGSQFDEYLATNHPDLKGSAQLYVREVRHGSIIADLVPVIRDIIGLMDDVIIVKGFTDLFRYRLETWRSGKFVPDATKSNIKHMAETIRAVGHDRDGTARVHRIVYKEGRWENHLEVEFTAPQAREALNTIEGQKRALDTRKNVDHSRVLMTFKRTDIENAEVGKRSGELVVINDIQSKPLPLMYGSELAEQRIKEEIRDHDSVYYKGFVVDVNVQQSSAGRNHAYSVTHVHQVIDLPSED